MSNLKKYDMGGIFFFIPCNEDEFLKDVVKVDEKELPAPAPVDHDDWYDNQHAFDQQNHIPESYK